MSAAKVARIFQGLYGRGSWMRTKKRCARLGLKGGGWNEVVMASG